MDVMKMLKKSKNYVIRNKVRIALFLGKFYAFIIF